VGGVNVYLLFLFKISMKQAILIAPKSNAGGVAFLTIGAVAFVVTLAIIKFKPGNVLLFDFVVLVAFLLCALLGVLKLMQPRVAMRITARSITFYHRVGFLRIAHANIAQVGNVYIEANGQHIELACFGIRVKSFDEVLKRMPPRLAQRLMMEQRHFLLAGIKARFPDGRVPDGWLFEDTQFVSNNHNRWRGLLGMFGNRAEHNLALFGYHLLFPYSLLDRSESEFVNLLQHWLLQPQQTIEKCSTINRDN
jgi:hypothetical protein